MSAQTSTAILPHQGVVKGLARWKSVPNARFYEVLVSPVVGAPLTLAEPVMLTSAKVEVELPMVPPGTLVTLCVRAVGAKGAGPYCDGLATGWWRR